MKQALGLFIAAIFWGICALLFPFALMAFFFTPLNAAICLAVVAGVLLIIPIVSRKRIQPSFRSSLFVIEIAMIAVVTAYYSSDRRPRECDFELDSHVRPLVTYRQCTVDWKGAPRERDCLAITSNPYDFAWHEGDLLVVSGRDHSTLGRITPGAHGKFSATPLGYGNAQEIVTGGHDSLAVISFWKARKIILFDLAAGHPVKSFPTRVSKLLGADRIASRVFVTSELPWLYEIDPASSTMKEHSLGYSLHTLNGLRIDSTRRVMYLSDWVWGKLYRIDLSTMKTTHTASPGMVSTGITLDTAACEVFVARTLASKIDVFDCRTLKLKRSLHAGFGVNELALSEDGRYIYATRYFAGEFVMLDRATGLKVRQFHIGGQPRALLYSPADGHVFAGSKCGIYEISPH